ncbi:MAG: DUF4365 domain-containing protein [bacterium]
MERPEQHIIETQSKKLFERIVPNEWVTHEMQIDYGIDYSLEIFKNKQTTGKFFFVQLKGSMQKIVNDTFKKQFAVESLEYYASLTLPVLIVFVSIETEQIWAIWANKLLESYTIKNKQKSVIVSLNENYLINESSFVTLENDLNSVNKFGIIIHAQNEIEKLLNVHIIKWIKHFYENTFLIDNQYMPNQIEFIYSSSKNNELSFKIKSNSFSQQINIGVIKEDNLYINRPVFNENDINEINKDILKIIAICFAKYDIRGSLLILRNLINYGKLISHDDYMSLDPVGLLQQAKAKREIELFNAIMKEIIDKNLHSFYLFFDLAYFIVDPESKEFKKYRVENLTRLIEKSNEIEIKGLCHYNIGNILKTESDGFNTLEHYFKARRIYPNYKKRAYWWKEVAGLLFSKKHYKCAEKFYLKSLEIKESTTEEQYIRIEKISPQENYLVLALLGDCLFFQGKFREANNWFSKYFNITNSNNSEWLLKNSICLKFIELGFNEEKIDELKSMEFFESAYTLTTMDGNIGEIIILLEASIELNPLNGGAWFNLGVALNQQEKYEKALLAFLITGIIQDNDTEAQFNALVLAFNLGDWSLFQTLITFILAKHGEKVENDLSDYIMKNDMSFEHKKKIIKAFCESIEAIRSAG